jgi:hypothetical protein
VGGWEPVPDTPTVQDKTNSFPCNRALHHEYKKVQGMHIGKCTCLSFSGEFSTSSVFLLSSYSFLKKVDVTKEFEAFLI